MLTEQLQHALNTRVVIEQAKGVLAQLGNAPMDVAFAHLRHYARSHNALLGEAARQSSRTVASPGRFGPG